MTRLPNAERIRPLKNLPVFFSPLPTHLNSSLPGDRMASSRPRFSTLETDLPHSPSVTALPGEELTMSVWDIVSVVLAATGVSLMWIGSYSLMRLLDCSPIASGIIADEAPSRMAVSAHQREAPCFCISACTPCAPSSARCPSAAITRSRSANERF